MSLPSLLALAVGLAMDATAVAAARGAAARELRPRDVARVALIFGGFQALMPLVGWLLGSAIGRAIAAWDHFVAFGLLSAIGVHMLLEARRSQRASSARADAFGLRPLLVLGVATSIDALAAGVTLPMLGAPLPLSVAAIGVTTAVLAALGLYAGRRAGAALGRRLDVAGGVILILLGVKVLAHHLALGLD
jgi:manganese efflux pump family protein